MMTQDSLPARTSTILSTHAFEEFYNNRPKSRDTMGYGGITREEGRNDIVESIIPKPGPALGMDGRNNLALDCGSAPSSRGTRGASGSAHDRQKSLPESESDSGAISDEDDEESSFGELPMPRLGAHHSGNLSENSAPSPDRRSSRSSSRNGLSIPSIPGRASPTGTGNSSGSGRLARAADADATYKVTRGTEDARHRPPQRSRQTSVQIERSSTPPPIGRVRRRTEGEADGDDSGQPHGQQIIRKASSSTEASQVASVPRSYSQRSLASTSQQSRRSSKIGSRNGTGLAAEYAKLGSESSLLPPSSGHRPRSRKESVRPFSDVMEDEDSVPKQHSRQDEKSDAKSRQASLTSSSSAPRPFQRTRRMLSDDGISTSTKSIADRRSIISYKSTGPLPDFFSWEIFQVVLRNPITAHQLLKFSETRLCNENIEFLNKVDEYQKALTHLSDIMGDIHKDFISHKATNQLDLPFDVVNLVYRDMKSLTGKTLPGMETLFTDMQERTQWAVFADVYPRFIRHQLALSATKALADDRHRYGGLGDCFCLTNPLKADNPIVFASDGFVKVTGYGRPEIIPRNCRFLQGAQTDRVPINRLKKAIADCKESVELILNYKKNGDPFWNLLYVAPLYNQNGKIAFFIGGQVNCSTTIHSNADIMKVLSSSASGEVDEEETSAPASIIQKQGTLPSARKAFLKALGVRVDEIKLPAGPAGMENQVLHRMEGRDLDAQVKEFYTAYSKYLVVSASNWVISYYSEGVVETLNPANNPGLLAGQEVFRFFKQNTVAKETEYRSKVRNAIRSGNPISVELRLQTRRSAKFRGDEVFATHWTPLKDENAATHWVVIALASAMQ